MIEKLVIRNYGKHRSLILRLGRHVTCLRGNNFAGKSTILRALRWILLNRPHGTNCINWESKQARVTLNLDGHKITRLRSKSKNRYKLDDVTYSAFGNDVPQPIERLVNVSESNFQKQHDAPFWFSESAGEVNRQLNQIVSLGLIDRTLGNLAGLQRRTSAEIRVTEENLEQLRQQLERDKPYVEMKREISVLDKQFSDIELLNERIQRLRSMMDSAEEYRRRSTKPPSIKPVMAIVVRLTKVTDRIDKLRHKIKLARTAKLEAEQHGSTVDRLIEQLQQGTKGRCPLCGKKATVKSLLLR